MTMLFNQTSPDVLYEALLLRDASYDGQIFVGVTSTGVFCRLTCPARKPKRENCRFYKTVGACIEAGFRACKRCHPLQPATQSDPIIKALLQLLEESSGRRLYEQDIIQLGYDPSTVRRAFKRHFGITFLEFARLTRLQQGFNTLHQHGSVIEAQLDAGFDSGSGFRRAFAKLLGIAPKEFRQDGFLRADMINTPLGQMIAISDPTHLHLLEFVDRKALPTELKKLNAAVKGNIGLGRYPSTDQVDEELSAFFKGELSNFKTPLALSGSAFNRSVWAALRNIPIGETRSYAEIAMEIDMPMAARAVARANGANQIAVIIPCHRVIGSDGSMTGYGGGLWRKQKLISIEQQSAAANIKEGNNGSN